MSPSYSLACEEHFSSSCAASSIPHGLGSVFGRTDFSRIFIFGPADFFRGFCRRICSPRFCGKKCKTILQENPGKILQNLYNKNPRHISAEGPGQHRFPLTIASLAITQLNFVDIIVGSMTEVMVYNKGRSSKEGYWGHSKRHRGRDEIVMQ